MSRIKRQQIMEIFEKTRENTQRRLTTTHVWCEWMPTLPSSAAVGKQGTLHRWRYWSGWMLCLSFFWSDLGFMDIACVYKQMCSLISSHQGRFIWDEIIFGQFLFLFGRRELFSGVAFVCVTCVREGKHCQQREATLPFLWIAYVWVTVVFISYQLCQSCSILRLSSFQFVAEFRSYCFHLRFFVS